MCGYWTVHRVFLVIVTVELVKVLVVATGGSNECQVTNVGVAVDNSTFSIKYNLTVNNASLCQDKALSGQYVPCSKQDPSYCNECQSSPTLKVNSEEWIAVQKTGQWRLSVVGKALSRCFSIRGNEIGANEINYDQHYSTKGLTMTMQRDERVKNASITLYKVTTPGSIPCSRTYEYKMKEIETLYPDPEDPLRFRSSNVFSPTDCLCFKRKLTGYGRYSLMYNVWINNPRTEGNCTRPFDETVDEDSSPSWIIALIVAMLLVSIVIAIAVAVSRRRWHLRPARNATPKSNVSVPAVSEVLMLYTNDMTACKQLQQIKDELLKHLKVSDLWQLDDPSRFGDENAWVENKVSGNKSVKVVVVESPALQSILHSILDGKDEEKDPSQMLLKFALRKITAWDHCDYNRIFIIRLCDGDDQEKSEASLSLDGDRNTEAINMNKKEQQESHLTHSEGHKDQRDFLVDRRRYLLPNHYNAFMADLGAHTQPATTHKEKADV
ncbi:hypothetical protein Pcinc_014819 [Petrolisthes cinctipes]|uniref:SEFIR domain-containing protein n=1 Tax=Petrolisthes cinctipes TaxID=88211 RepID=A0AAE1FVQ2_PETCI|nr:hypothetical protein Pcinc_014819 [Petrolisthes cinctipes]